VSVAVAVGFMALVAVAAEIGVVMLIDLGNAEGAAGANAISS
jgi:Cu/Ag efflux pump CusA